MTSNRSIRVVLRRRRLSVIHRRSASNVAAFIGAFALVVLPTVVPVSAEQAPAPHAAPRADAPAIEPSPPASAIDPVQAEIDAHYAKADAEVKEYIRWTAKTFGPGGLWFAEDAFALLSAEEREKKVLYIADVLQGEYGRHLCDSLAQAGALKDARLLPGLIKAASYHRDDSDYDCRPKWMACAALGRQDDIAAAPTLIPLVDHGNQNTRMWARASLVRLTGQNFAADKRKWAEWWNASGHTPAIDTAQLKPWQPPTRQPAAAPTHAEIVPAVVPPEAQSVVDDLPGELILRATYHHRSRNQDFPMPSMLWVKRADNEVIAASYLPSMNSTIVAYTGADGKIARYDIHGHGRDGGPPSVRSMTLTATAVTVSNAGGRLDGVIEEITVPSEAGFQPNTRPDPYVAHMAVNLRAPLLETVELDCYDWDNSGKGMATYRTRIEYKGREAITVPAGTFDAHHAVETQQTFGDTWYKKRPNHVTEYWYLDNGVAVRIFRHREPYELLLMSFSSTVALPNVLNLAEGATPVAVTSAAAAP